MSEDGGEAESQFERWRGRVGLGAAPLTAAILWNAPLPLEWRAHKLAAMAALIFIMWITECVPIAVTAILVAPILVVAGIAPASAAFAPYADPILYLFIGSFFIAKAMGRHGLDRRIAAALARRAGKRPIELVLWTALLISMWISNTATTAIVLPIAVALTAGAPKNVTSAAVIASSFAASIGGVGTPVGTPPNLIAMRYLRESGNEVSFAAWASLGVPTALLTGVALMFVLRWLAPSWSAQEGDAPAAATTPARMTRGERVTAFSFSLAVVGWVVPGVLSSIDTRWRWLSEMFPEGVVGLLAAAPLFLVRERDGETPVLPWKDATSIDWGIFVLFGGGLALGKQLFDTGLATTIGRAIVLSTGLTSVWTLVAVVIVVSVVLSEICSNTATAAMLAPLVIGVASEMHVPIIPPLLACGLAASLGFMLPIATGSNALAYGSGRVRVVDMMKLGAALDVAGAVIVFVVIRIASSIAGWA